MTELKSVKEITSWTCECNCVTFDNGKCRACGKLPKYGEIDYEELKAEAVKWVKNNFDAGRKDIAQMLMIFFNLTEEDLK